MTRYWFDTCLTPSQTMTMDFELKLPERDKDKICFLLVESVFAYFIFRVERLDDESFMVKLVLFQTLSSDAKAKKEFKAISEGIVTDTLKEFLYDYPRLKAIEKKKCYLGVGDVSLGLEIRNCLRIDCRTNGHIRDLRRVVLKSYDWAAAYHANIKAAHLVQVQRVMAINIAAQITGLNPDREKYLLEWVSQLTKTIKFQVAGLREIYGHHFPELSDLNIRDEEFVRLIKHLGTEKHDFSEEKMEFLKIIFGYENGLNEHQLKDIRDRAKSSRQEDLPQLELLTLQIFASHVLKIFARRKKILEIISDPEGTKSKQAAREFGETSTQAAARVKELDSDALFDLYSRCAYFNNLCYMKGSKGLAVLENLSEQRLLILKKLLPEFSSGGIEENDWSEKLNENDASIKDSVGRYHKKPDMMLVEELAVLGRVTVRNMDQCWLVQHIARGFPCFKPIVVAHSSLTYATRDVKDAMTECISGEARLTLEWPTDNRLGHYVIDTGHFRQDNAST